MQAIVRHPKPVIAEVHGIATAAGFSWSPAAIWRSRPIRPSFRDAGGEYRALLLDADGGAVAQPQPQARDEMAADGESVSAARAAALVL